MFGRNKDKDEENTNLNPGDEQFYISDEPLPDHPSIPKDLRFMPSAAARASATDAFATGAVPPGIIDDLSTRNDDIGRLARTFARAGKVIAGATSGNVNEMVDAAFDAAKIVDDVRREAASRGIKDPFGAKPPSGPPASGGSSGGGGRSGPFDFTPGYHLHNSLSMEPDPFISDFRTDIRPLFFVPNYQRSEEAYSQTLYCSAIQVSIPTGTDTALGEFTSQVIQDIRSQIARNVNVSTSLTTRLSYSQLVGYFNNVLKLLAQYYTMKRYFSWAEPKPLVRNDGLYAIRNSITATQIQMYSAAERCLAGLPIPPNMNLFCSWFYQLHSSGPHAMSPILQIDPFSMTNGVYNWNEISVTVAALSNDSQTDVANVIARAFPNWEDPKLFTPPRLPMYDEGFLTIWRNLPFYYSGTNPVSHTVKGPTVTNLSDTVKYNTFANDLDGCAWALFGAYVSGLTTPTWIPTLITPIDYSSTLTSGNVTNRYHYGITGGIAGFYDSYVGNVPMLSRDETYVCNSNFTNSVITSQVAGSARVDFVDPQTCIEAARAFVDWLVTWDSINVRVDKSLQNKRKDRPNKYKSNKRKGK